MCKGIMALLLGGAISILGQTPSQITLYSGPPQAVQYVSAATVGNPGNGNYYYWVIARYTRGTSIPSQFAAINNAPSLSASNYVQVNWNGVSGATGYDVLRTDVPYLPFGACTCAVAANTSAQTVNDTGSALQAYVFSTVNSSSFTLNLNNIAYARPTLEFMFSDGMFTVDKNGLSPSGSASGDLSGTFPGPTVAKIQGRAVSSSAPSNGNCLAWNTSNNDWEPSGTCGGTGSVTSVGLVLPAEITVSNSPVTSSGNLTGAWASAAQHAVFSGPSASAGTPTFRALVASDLPAALVYNNQANTFTAGSKVVVAPSATTAGVRITAGALPSTPATGDLAIDSGAANALKYWNGSAWATPGGTVTSVGLSLPSFITVTNSPVSTSGTLTGTLATQVANTVFTGPSTGADAAPTFRALVKADQVASTVYNDAANSYTAGAKQLVQPSATLAGFRVGCAALPSTPAAGDVACDSAAANAMKWWDGSQWSAMGTNITTAYATIQDNAGASQPQRSIAKTIAPLNAVDNGSTITNLSIAGLTTVGSANQIPFSDGSQWNYLGLGEGLTLASSTLSIDTATIPSFADSATVPASCTAYGQFYFNTSAGTSAKLYYCNGSTYEFAGGGGDVTLAGANVFTGSNNFAATSSFVTRVASSLVQTINGSFGLDTSQGAFAGFSNSTASRGFFTRVPVGWVTNSVTDILCALATDTPPTGTCTGHAATTEALFTQKVTLPANLPAFKVLRVTFGLANTGAATVPIPNLNLNVRLGTVKIWTNTAFGYTSKTYSLQCLIQIGGAPSAATNVFTHCQNFATVAGGAGNMPQPVAIATNATQDLQLSALISNNTSGNWTYLQTMLVEEIN